MAENTGFVSSVKEMIKMIFWALIIVGVFCILFFQLFWILSGLMKDTLLIGDFLFVNKMAYGYFYVFCPLICVLVVGVDIGVDDFCGWFDDSNDWLFGFDPACGDVVVFWHLVIGMDFIKCLIGELGDWIQMIDGVLHINDTAVGLVDVGTFIEIMEPQGLMGGRSMCANGLVGVGAECLKLCQIEMLSNGISYVILNIAMWVIDNTGVYMVPVDYFFFMGDNCDNSVDSCVLQMLGGVGFVLRKDIVGRADCVMFLLVGWLMLAFWMWRSDCFFKVVE